MHNLLIEKIIELLNNPDSKPLVESCFDKINKPLLHIKEVGVSSKQIMDWKKAGLFYETNPNGWTEFSVRDAIWLKFIQELRKFGMPYEVIKQVKQAFLFDIDTINEKISQIKEDENGNEIIEAISVSLENASLNIDFDKNDKLNLFEMIVVALLLFKFKIDISFYFDEDHFAFVPSYEPLTHFQKDNMNKLQYLMSKKTFVLINMKYLMSGFFENEKLDHVEDLFLGLMNKFEKEILTKVRSGDYQQVIVKIDNGEVIQLRLKKKKDPAAENKISRLFKKGDYKEIQLITRDGKVVSYDEIEIIKMNNN
jgi:DNA-binding transcriptional MerR regulator